jgi:hypothetical protein
MAIKFITNLNININIKTQRQHTAKKLPPKSFTCAIMRCTGLFSTISSITSWRSVGLKVLTAPVKEIRSSR